MVINTLIINKGRLRAEIGYSALQTTNALTHKKIAYKYSNGGMSQIIKTAQKMKTIT
jgi:hypothetical protein